jgi:hypothetical protein
MNQGWINEYYDVIESALRVELNRQPTEEEILEILENIKRKYFETSTK